MKPTILAKKIWDHAVDITKQNGAAASYYTTPLFNYAGILTMYACAQAAVVTNDQEWIEAVNSYLAKYPFEYETPGIYFHYNFDNYLSKYHIFLIFLFALLLYKYYCASS